MADVPIPPASERIFASYKQLAASAQALSSASDELSKPMAALDAALKRLNLGIAAWVRIRGSDDDGYGNYWGDDVGYAKIAGKWGLALRSKSGNHNSPPEMLDHEEWLFNDAPRSLRIDAIDKIPDLVEKLITSAEKTARKIKDKATEAQSLADALNQAAEELKPKPKPVSSAAPPPTNRAGTRRGL